MSSYVGSLNETTTSIWLALLCGIKSQSPWHQGSTDLLKCSYYHCFSKYELTPVGLVGLQMLVGFTIRHARTLIRPIFVYRFTLMFSWSGYEETLVSKNSLNWCHYISYERRKSRHSTSPLTLLISVRISKFFLVWKHLVFYHLHFSVRIDVTVIVCDGKCHFRGATSTDSFRARHM